MRSQACQKGSGVQQPPLRAGSWWPLGKFGTGAQEPQQQEKSGPEAQGTGIHQLLFSFTDANASVQEKKSERPDSATTLALETGDGAYCPPPTSLLLSLAWMNAKPRPHGHSFQRNTALAVLCLLPSKCILRFGN